MMMDLQPLFENIARPRNPRVTRALIGPAIRGFVLQKGKKGATTTMATAQASTFDWGYRRESPELARLYTAAKTSQ
jgi:hypothetical protein